MKLSKTQLEVLQLMNNGWELGYSSGYISDVWLQKGGIGCGGERKDVRINTFFVIYHTKKLVEVNENGFPTMTYKLTEEAKELLKEV